MDYMPNIIFITHHSMCFKVLDRVFVYLKREKITYETTVGHYDLHEIENGQYLLTRMGEFLI